MKTLKPFILVSLLLCGLRAIACGPWYYTADDNDIYRLLPYGAEGPAVALSPDFSRENLLLWSKQTGCKDTAAIRQAIYKGTLQDWQQLYQRPDNSTTSGWFAANPFVKHLAKRHNRDAIQLLYFSKQYESLRQAKTSPWYYDGRSKSKEDRQIQTLYDSARQWLTHNGKSKYADRYRFLAMKCCWASGDAQSTLALWEQMKHQLKGSIFYAEAEDYAARCLYQTGRRDEAYAFYLQRGDIASLMLFSDMDLAALLELVLRIAPESDVIPVELQRMLFALENNPHALSNKICLTGYEDHRNVLRIARQAAQTTVRSRRAMWAYTAACLLDYEGKPAEALRELEGIDKLPCDDFLKRSIRVLRFHLHSKTDKVDDAFERYALGELRWMDGELQKEWQQLSADERKMMSHLQSVNTGFLFRSCYMYDAMRRIVLPDSVGLSHRLAFNGRQIRALQLSNMVENRLIALADNKVIADVRQGHNDQPYRWNDDPREHPGFQTWGWLQWLDPDTTGANGYYEDNTWNSHDYCNWMFLLADKMDAATLDAYRNRQLHPRDDTDRWLNERGYLDGDYWEDIIGTHYLREGNYAAAVEHLRLVSPTYQQRMNIAFLVDPFSLADRIPSHNRSTYKLEFAERMSALQQEMMSSDPDRSGLAMLEYAIGMRNSYDQCWYLTTYGKTAIRLLDPSHPSEDDEWAWKAEEVEWSWAPLARLTATNHKYKLHQNAVADSWQQKAFATLRSDEAKAKAYARIGEYATVVKRFTRTATAQHLALVCDEWRSYRL